MNRGKWQESDFTMPQFKTMLLLDCGHNTIRLLAETIGVSPPVVSGIVDRLEQRELLTRQRDSADRRSVVISLTPLGRQKVAEFQHLAVEQLVSLFGEMTPEEVSALAAGLEALERGINNVKKP